MSALGTDLDEQIVVKITDLFKGKYVPEDAIQEAQLRELAFWRWVAFEGYAGKRPEDFPLQQRQFMVAEYQRTGWPLDRFRESSIFELGCGPLGMIEFIVARERYAYDPLNEHYTKLFGNVRSQDIYYLQNAEQLSALKPMDFGICFNVLDHTPDAGVWFHKFVDWLKKDASFLLQVNTIREGYTRSLEHRKMHPSPIESKTILSWLSQISTTFEYFLSDVPSADNEFYFIAWGSKNLR